MRRNAHRLTAGLVVILTAGSVTGCLNDILSVQGGTDRPPTDSLTDSEQQAVLDAIFSAESLTDAANAFQGATDDEQIQSGLTVPDTGTLNFGTCPNVTIQAGTSGTAQATLSMTVDFGDGCSPPNSADYTISGSATGTFSEADDAFAIDFNGLTVNGDTLSGGVELNFERVPGDVQLTGDWDLAVSSEGEQATTDGLGTVGFDAATQTTTIATFNGTITGSGGTVSASMTEIQASVAQNGNAIPFSGSATLSGSDIRTVTVTFDENSPNTGDVSVSVDGSEEFTVNLFDL